VPLWVWVGWFGAERREWLLDAVHHGHGVVVAIAGAVIVLVAWALWRGARKRVMRLQAHRARRAMRADPLKAKQRAASAKAKSRHPMIFRFAYWSAQAKSLVRAGFLTWPAG
jgi:hypothetical protein